MRAIVRSWFDLTNDPAVAAANAANAEAQERRAALEAARDALKRTVEENVETSQRQRRAVQERLAWRARRAEAVLDAYDSVSAGRIIFDQLGQLVAKIHDMIQGAAKRDMGGYGFRSKQYFSAALTADAARRHWAAGAATCDAPFDHLLHPLVGELSDAGVSAEPLAPLDEFAHTGRISDARLHGAVLALRQALAAHRQRVGGNSASGKRVSWEALADAFKFTTATVTAEATLMEQADACVDSIEDAVRRRQWGDASGTVAQLWKVVAPTVRGHAAQATVNVPLLQALFDIRDAADQRAALAFADAYLEGVAARQGAAFTDKLFDMRPPPPPPSLPADDMQ
jgi:hypothetical protein